MYGLFDVGGSNIRIGISQDGKTLDKSIIIATRTYGEAITTLVTELKKLSLGKKFKAIAGGVAGPLDKKKAYLIASPHLPTWINRPLKTRLQSELATPVYLENDSALVALGEAVYGAGRGHKIVAYLSISTGVGGARIVEGKIDQNALGFEPGHQIFICPEHGTLDPDTIVDSHYPHLGHFEGLISGQALAKRYQKDPAKITDKSIWDIEARHIAYGINNILVFWSPDVVVLGGGVTKNKFFSVTNIQMHLKNIVRIFPALPPLKKAELKDIGGLYGALALVQKAPL